MRVVGFGDVVAAVALVEIDGLGDVDETLHKLRGTAIGCEVQLFDPDMLLDWEHFDATLISAVLSFKSGGSAKSLGLEYLTKLAATRQVSQAIAKAGVRSSSRQVGVLVLGYDYNTVLEAAKRVLETLGGTQFEPSYSAQRGEMVARRHGISTGPMTHIQAENRLEAVKLAIIQKAATSII